MAREFEEVILKKQGEGEEDHIAKVEDFFYDGPNLEWKPLPPHDLEQSPCAPIIYIDDDGLFYRCRLHPQIRYERLKLTLELRNIHLETIEHHCKYFRPEEHKAEIISRIMKSEN